MGDKKEMHSYTIYDVMKKKNTEDKTFLGITQFRSLWTTVTILSRLAAIFKKHAN